MRPIYHKSKTFSDSSFVGPAPVSGIVQGGIRVNGKIVNVITLIENVLKNMRDGAKRSGRKEDLGAVAMMVVNVKECHLLGPLAGEQVRGQGTVVEEAVASVDLSSRMMARRTTESVEELVGVSQKTLSGLRRVRRERRRGGTFEGESSGEASSLS